ncbi:MAG TPA: magnesium transporter [Gemmatimonadaceae bacterium]
MARDGVIQLLAQAELRQYPNEAAPLLERTPAQEAAHLLERQEPGVAADALRRLRADRAAAIIQALHAPAATRVVAALEPTVAAALIARLDDEAREERLASLDETLARELSELMSYPSDVAGGLMDPRATAFRPETTAREALAHLRTLGNRAIHEVFVIDEERRLTGSVGIQELALAAPDARLDELAEPNPPRIQALAPQEELVALVEERRLASLPVIDIGERLIGVVRYADLLRATQRDATADIQTMVGVSREERALSTAAFAVRKRLPWLQINLATAFLAAAVVGIFEDTIAQFTALAVLLPVVAGQSGNTGAQSLAVTMRGLTLREIQVRHWLRMARKELAVGAINGVAVALVTSFGVYVWSQSIGIAAVIGASMICSIVIAGLAGVSVPMLLTLLRQDPAAASSIVLTTITDVTGFLTFLGFATLASGML